MSEVLQSITEMFSTALQDFGDLATILIAVGAIACAVLLGVGDRVSQGTSDSAKKGLIFCVVAIGIIQLVLSFNL